MATLFLVQSERRPDRVATAFSITVAVRVLRHPQEAEVVGQVVGIALKLGEWLAGGVFAGSETRIERARSTELKCGGAPTKILRQQGWHLSSKSLHILARRHL